MTIEEIATIMNVGINLGLLIIFALAMYYMMTCMNEDRDAYLRVMSVEETLVRSVHETQQELQILRAEVAHAREETLEARRNAERWRRACESMNP